ncbi:MAG: DMT family transporter [Candidatus Puniceispirillaceae bacterium]
MSPAPINSQMRAHEWAMLVLLSSVWAGSFFFNGVAVRELPVMSIVLGRVGIATLLLVPWLIWRGAALPRDPVIWRAFLMMGLFNNVLPFCLIVWGQGHISSGQAAILNATTPIFTVIVAHFLTDDERLSPTRLAGILVGFAGVAVMVGGGVMRDSGATLAAYCALLGASLSYGYGAVFGRRFRNLGVAPMTTAAGQLACASLLLLPLWLLVDRPWQMDMPGMAALLAVLGIACISTAFAYGLYFRILTTAGATNLSLVTILIPPGAILLGVLFLDEVLLTRHLLGLGLILAGLAVTDGRILRRRQA